jgi:alcohol dehydrogenase YqhD (iron-dependent ADH family)
VWDYTETDDETAAIAGIEKMAEYFKSIGMPTYLGDFGIDTGCTERYAELCTLGKQRTVMSYIDMDYDAINDIFKM